MAKNDQRRPTRGGAAADLGKDVAANDSVTPASTQSLPSLHVEIVREQLKNGPIPLSLCSDARWRWKRRGLTLRQRDDAAKLLVAWGEAEYRILPDQRLSPVENVVHLVAAPQEGGAT